VDPILVLINRCARKGAVDTDRLIEVFLRNGGRALIHFPDNPDRMGELIGDLAPGCRAVVIGGGDGSVNAALKPIMAAGKPLGILPLGTANDLARTLSIPTALESAVEVATRGDLRAVDVGLVNGNLFMNAAHVGLGSRVTAALGAGSKSRWGVLAYLGAVWRAVRGIHPFRADIATLTTRQELRTIGVAVGNGRHYGGGMTMQNAAIDDHLLHVYSLRPMPVGELIPVLFRLRRGTYAEHEKVDVLAADRLEVRTSRPRWVTVDGERRTRTPARFQVLRSALQVRVPNTGKEPTR
jgi:YegS/Rv2252/BmrU family lipid kinase